ncbi:MAG: cyclic pyranopterin monophosphate synthase [Thermoproteota archaeon]|nr:cyclic pyranopterin monophosphate synthase [Thermoproteota archaeon]
MRIRSDGPSMVDITLKSQIQREATAIGKIILKSNTVNLIRNGEIEKGDPINTAKVAAVLAAKNTSGIIPLCHPIPITNVKIEDEVLVDGVIFRAFIKTTARTGVEMEALTAVSVALLTIWDMVKQYEKDERGQYPSTAITDIRVLQKVKGSRKMA